MKAHDLRAANGAKHRKKRVGRGKAAGQGKTAGRGTKGQGSRSGGGKAPYFEGGQLPLVRRLPNRRGFTNIRRVEYDPVNLERLNRFPAGSEVDPELLVKAGIIKSTRRRVKILGRGEIGHSLVVKAHRFSASARRAIEEAGGTAVQLEA